MPLHWVDPDKCRHPNARQRLYLGSATDWYWHCPDCFTTWGGEETPAKHALVDAAARAPVTEDNEEDHDP